MPAEPLEHARVRKPVKVLGICGSQRRRSFNMAALNACRELLPPDMTLEFGRIDDLPMFNQDVLEEAIPQSVNRLAAEVRQADGLLIASPEYNFSVTPLLKNAIDWLSKLTEMPLANKPAAVFSVSIGPLGGPRVQYDLRRILTQLWVHVLPRPEVFIGSAASKFSPDGVLSDVATSKLLSAQLMAFRDWTIRFRA